ncbi:hypothetical protein TFLX_02316 [Thermoflexales bacterium]|nr:hypothetical protein TFLX_02316 [Thermoflexales bacterium]
MADTAGTFTDLEIRIFQKQEQGYPVEITLGGQQEFPRGFLPAEVLPWSPGGDVVADGSKLFEMLFKDGTLRGAWAEARGRAPQRRLRFRIDPQAAELHALPWELLLENQALLAAQADTPFSRYLPIALPWSGAVEQRPIKLLVAISDPDDLKEKYDLAQADVALERKALEEAFAHVDQKSLEVTFMEAPITLERIEEELRKGYHIFHYLGHGAYNSKRQQAALYLQDAAGHAKRALDDEIVSMVARQGVRPHLIFLAACQSAVRSSADAFVGLGPKLVSAGVPAVIAMQDFVTVDTARKFSSAFYQRLVEHGQVDRAGNEARSSLLTAGRPDASVPVAFLRLKSAQLWGNEVDARGEVLGSKNPKIFWTGLIRMLQQGKCTPLIGPRVCGRWIPSRNEIAERWAIEHGYPFGDKVNLARVAQYMASSQGEDFPRGELMDTTLKEMLRRLPEELRPAKQASSLTELVNAVGFQTLVADDPNEVHRVLAALNLPLYLTTNFVSFMTESLQALQRKPTRELCRWNERLDGLPSIFEERPDYRPTPEEPLVYHFFGTDDEPDSVVLTEDNYFDWLVKVSAEPERVPPVIQAAMTNTQLMFLGYSMHDIEFRVIMRGLIATRGQRRNFKHVAVQLDVDDVQVENVGSVQTFLQQYFQDAEINVYWGSMEQFISELKEQWENASR